MPNQDGILTRDPGGQLRVERVAEDRRGAGVGVDRGEVVRAQFDHSCGAQAVAGPCILGQHWWCQLGHRVQEERAARGLEAPRRTAEHRSEEGRGGKEWVSTCRSRWSPYQ